MRKFLVVATLVALAGAGSFALVGDTGPSLPPTPVADVSGVHGPGLVPPVPAGEVFLPPVAVAPALVPVVVPAPPITAAKPTPKVTAKKVAPKTFDNPPVQPGGDWGETPCYLQTHDRTAECLYRDKVQNEQDAAADKATAKKSAPKAYTAKGAPKGVTEGCGTNAYWDSSEGTCRGNKADPDNKGSYVPDESTDEHPAPLCGANYSYNGSKCVYHKPTGTDEDN